MNSLIAWMTKLIFKNSMYITAKWLTYFIIGISMTVDIVVLDCWKIPVVYR